MIVAKRELRIWPESFSAIIDGRQHFLIRNTDNDIAVGDVLVLQEWQPGTRELTGRVAHVDVTSATVGVVDGRSYLPCDVGVYSVELVPAGLIDAQERLERLEQLRIANLQGGSDARTAPCPDCEAPAVQRFVAGLSVYVVNHRPACPLKVVEPVAPQRTGFFS